MATIRTDERTGNLFKRLTVKLPSGKKVRTQASPAAYGLPQTESGMREAEQRKVAEVYAQHATPTFNPSPNPVAASIVDAPPTITVTAKEVPTFGAYFPTWYANGETNGNKVQTLYKKRTFRNAVLPRFANARLDAIDALGAFTVAFGGGEPLVRRDLAVLALEQWEKGDKKQKQEDNRRAIAKAEAILAGARDPDGDGGAS